MISAVYEDGRATCHFSFETNSAQAEDEPAPITIDKNYYLTFASGKLRSEGKFFFGLTESDFFFITLEQISKHNFTFITSKTYQIQNPETINLDESIVSLIRQKNIFRIID